jgi:TolB protein
MIRPKNVQLAVGAFSLVLIIGSLATAAGGAHAKPAKQRVDTRIVFSNNHLCSWNDCGNGEIAVVNLNGSNFRRLTHNFVTDESPAWSPAKQRIAFMRFRTDGFGLWIMDANRRHQRPLPGPKYANEPDWSPNGRMIVFSGGTSQPGYGGLWTVNVNTGHLTRLLWGMSSTDSPAWSPDGTRIAFGSNRDGTEQIWLLRVRDHRLTQLTFPTGRPPVTSYTPAWSPDGRRIAVWRAGYIWIMRADDSHARRVGGPADEFTWSADGRWIVFSQGSLFAIHPDGSGRHLIRHEAGGPNGWLDGGPDG